MSEIFKLSFVQLNDYSNLKVEKNILSNRLGVLNNQIDYNWLNLPLSTEDSTRHARGPV